MLVLDVLTQTALAMFQHAVGSGDRSVASLGRGGVGSIDGDDKLQMVMAFGRMKWSSPASCGHSATASQV